MIYLMTTLSSFLKIFRILILGLGFNLFGVLLLLLFNFVKLYLHFLFFLFSWALYFSLHKSCVLRKFVSEHLIIKQINCCEWTYFMSSVPQVNCIAVDFLFVVLLQCCQYFCLPSPMCIDK